MRHRRLFLFNKMFPNFFAAVVTVVETNNCGIAHILGIELMNSYNILIFLAATICSLSHSN